MISKEIVGIVSLTASYLISPLVDDGHINVVHEDGHLLAGRRSVGRSHSLVYVTLNRTLNPINQSIMFIQPISEEVSGGCQNVNKCNEIKGCILMHFYV